MSMTVKRKGMLLIISGPSGAGKGTLCKMLLERDKSFAFSCSVTTREPREGEVEGVDYRFIGDAEFRRMAEGGELLEFATVHGHLYGTPKREVDEMLSRHMNVLLDIDSQGAVSVMRKTQDYVSVFVIAPSFEELRRRLEKRNAERPDEIERRLRNAHAEMRKLDLYQYLIVNEDVEQAYAQLSCIVNAEKLRTVRFMPTTEED
jgi:guanylate kinase